MQSTTHSLMNRKVGRITPCAPKMVTAIANGAHGVTRPTLRPGSCSQCAKLLVLIRFLVAFTFLNVEVSAQAALSPQPPNIIFILVDDLRWDALGCMGHPFAKTPHIDRLAREGALFRNFFVTLPLCSPSRASFLTGQYAHTHRVIDNTDNSALSHRLITFPRLLREAGYETGFVGKLHMGNDDSPRPGFDRWVSFKGQGAYDDPVINADGKASKVEGYMTDILNRHAVEFVKKERAKPFLLCLAHKAIHGPFKPAERYKDWYLTNALPMTPNMKDNLEGKPALTRPLDTTAAKPKAAQKAQSGAQASTNAASANVHERIMRNQLRTLMAVDDGVGDLLKALEESRKLDSTLVIFTSDNGFFWGEHGLSDKRAAYDESIRDPLLMRFPRLIKAGTQIEQLALNIDIAPTLLDLAGAPIPKAIEGRSLLPLFKGDTKNWRASFLAEYFMEKNIPRVPTWQAVRTERWKYIRYPELEAMDELYDLKADPYEMKNLVHDSKHQSTLKELSADLERLQK